jgi:hypothetical protein
MSFFTRSLNSIKTKDVVAFANRWTAVISVIITFLVLCFAFWYLLFQQPLPVKTIRQQREFTDTSSNNLDGYFYFDGIGISGASTNFYGGSGSVTPSANDLAGKCKLFGDNCLGFDTLGSIFLARDAEIATLKGLQKKYKGGTYIKTTADHALSICEKLGGDFNENTRVCDNFNRGAISEFPFPHHGGTE